MSKISFQHALSIMRIKFKLEEISQNLSFIYFDYGSFQVKLHFRLETYSNIEFIFLDEKDEKIPAFIWKNITTDLFKVTKNKTIIGKCIETLSNSWNGVRAAEDSLMASINMFNEKLIQAREYYEDFKQNPSNTDLWIEKNFKKNYSPYYSFNMPKYSTFIEMNSEKYMTMFNNEFKKFDSFMLMIITISDTHLKVNYLKNADRNYFNMGDEITIENTELKNTVDDIIRKFELEIDSIRLEEEIKRESTKMSSYHPINEANPNSEFMKK
ncbi:hypothetical protein SteCoe_15677 [Stentor coeruleus]|uniref:Uncharacterized protein n=1 Tax=Stentor coeruleus TaxID=5963 RepID=A0A1R2C309_9CILI|nr:hypothetical protein SteCoe_15677 [Stentor coeruleus]